MTSAPNPRQAAPDAAAWFEARAALDRANAAADACWTDIPDPLNAADVWPVRTPRVTEQQAEALCLARTEAQHRLAATPPPTVAEAAWKAAFGFRVFLGAAADPLEPGGLAFMHGAGVADGIMAHLYEDLVRLSAAEVSVASDPAATAYEAARLADADFAHGLDAKGGCGDDPADATDLAADVMLRTQPANVAGLRARLGRIISLTFMHRAGDIDCPHCRDEREDVAPATSADLCLAAQDFAEGEDALYRALVTLYRQAEALAPGAPPSGDRPALPRAWVELEHRLATYFSGDGAERACAPSERRQLAQAIRRAYRHGLSVDAFAGIGFGAGSFDQSVTLFFGDFAADGAQTVALADRVERRSQDGEFIRVEVLPEPKAEGEA